MGCFAVIKENGKEIKFDDQKLLDEYLMERYKNPQIDFLNTKESLESLQTLNEMYDLKNQLDELQNSRNPIKKGKQSKVLQESIVNLQRKYNASVIKYDNLINDLKKNPKFNIKFQLDDNKSERWVHPTERQSENDKTVVVDEGETSSKGFAVLKGTGLETNGSVIYQGDQHPVISENTDKVSIRIGNEIVEVDKSKVLTEVLSDNTQKEEWFDLETEDIDLQNLDKSKLYDEVYNSGRLFNKEYSDEEVYGISAFVIEKALDKKANLKTLIKNAVDLYNNNIEQSPVSKSFSKTPDGHTQSTPNQTYNEAVTNNTRDKGDNLWVRDNKTKTNKDRTLLVQFSSMFLYGKNNFKRDKNSEYFDKLYRTKKGYDRTVDFWEVPLWMARLSGLEKNSDVYVIRNMDEAIAFFKEAEYGKVLFSALDVNEKHINRITTEVPDQSFQIGGYVNFQSLNDKPNVKTFNTVEQYAEYNNLKDEQRYSYRHFRGTAVIPRLKMSEGCTYKCAFCSIPKKVIPVTLDVIDNQVKEIKDLDATLVYLDDKTFGQAKNYSYLTDVYNQIKEGNPNFEGFVIQTTAVDFADEKRFSKEFLENSHIKYAELGIETYNDDILLKLNKRHSYKKYVDAALDNARKNNVNVIANVIVGLTGKNPDGSFWTETEKTYDNTLNLIKNNKDVISHMNVYSLALYEGTPLGDSIDVREEADKNENIVAKSFHENAKVHEKAMNDFSDLGIELLDNDTKFQLDDISLESINLEEGSENIDVYKASEAAEKIAKEGGINILRGKELITVALDKNKRVVGGLWAEIDKDEFSFDIAVDKLSQNKGIGEKLINEAINEFNAQDYESTLKYKLDVTNPIAEKLLSKYGFEVVNKIAGHTIMVHPTNNPKKNTEPKFQLDDIWHGGPHDITSFSTDKIGTGEGEQAFGWGLYFTDMEGIAEFYASVLSKPKLEDKNGNEIVLSKNLANLIKLVYAQHRDLSADLIRQKIKSVASTINRDWSTEAVKEFEQIGDFTLKPFRFKYKVTLHKNKSIDQYTWLDWDQKLNEDQLAKVKDIYDTFSNVETDHKRASLLSRAVDYYNFREKTGQQIYDTIVEEAGRHRGELERRFGDKVVWGRADKIASLLLLDAGIDGVKYPAESIAKGTNRETARGFNYVIFDDTAITIEEKTSFQFDDGPDTLEKAAKHYGVKPEEEIQDLRVSKNALNKEDQSQYRVSSGENIIEALKDFDNSNDAVTAIVHEVMHPTVVSIIDGAKEENEVGSKHTQTIVNEFNKANPDNAVTVEELIKDNDSFKNGKTTPKYRSVQEFIAKAWDDYHIEGIKTINKSFQKLLDQITEAFKNVYNSLKGSKILTPDLKKLFDELINPEETRFQFDEEKPKLEGQQKTKRDNVLKNLRDNIDRYKNLYGDSKGIYDKFKSMFDERGVTLLDVEHILRGLNPDKSVKQYKREAQQRIDKFEKVLTTAGFSDEEKHAIVNIYAEAAQSWAKKTGRSVVEWWSDIIEDFEYSKDGTDITVNPGESLVYQADEVIKSVWNKILSFFPNADKTTSTPYTEDKVLENNDSQFLDTNKRIIKGARKMLVNGKAIVYITSSATVATPVHELAHVYEMYMPETDKDQYLKEISKTKWDTDASERFALGFEKFLMDGRKTDNKNLQKIFDNFKTWLTDIYKGLLRWNGENVFLNRAMNRIYSQIFDTSITNIGEYKEVKDRMGKEMLNEQIKVNNATMQQVAEIFELELLNPYQRTTAIATVKQAVENGLIDAEGKTIINVANDLLRANRASGGSRAITPQEAVAIKYYIIKWGRQLANLETLVDQNPENGLMYKDYMELRTALLLLQQADGLGASLAASVLGSRSKVMKDDLFDAAAWVKRIKTADPDITPLKIREFVNLVNEAKETRDRLEAYTKSREAIVKQQEIDYLNKNIREFFKLPAVRNVMNKFKQSNKSFKQIEQDLIEQIRSHYDVKFSMDNDTDDDSALFELVIATLAANPDINTVTDLTNHMIANLPNIEKDEIIDILKAEWSIKGDPELDEEPKIGKKMTRLEEQKNNLKRELQLIEDLKDLFRAKEITGKVNVTKNSVTIRVLRNIIEELKSLSSQDNTTHHNLFMLHHYLDQIEKLHQASLFEITGGPISGVTRDIITKQLLENIDDYISARGTTMEGKIQSLQEKIEDIDRLTDDLNRMKEGKDTQKSYYGILKRINEVGLKEHKIEDAQLFKLRAELSKKTMILQERADEVSEKLGWRILKEAANMPRLLKLAFDYSFTLYQMGMYTYKQLASPNFFRVLRLMKDTIRASVSESYFERTTAAFEKEWGDHIYYQQQLGTIIPERNNQANPEEMLRTKTLLESVLNKVMPKYNFARGIRNFNERGYVTYIRQMRMMETMSMSQGIVDIETKRKIAERVNTFSGASQQFSNNPKWNKVINKGVEIGAYPFIAPRLYLSVYKSMINLLATPITAAKIPFTDDKYVKEYRKRVVKDNMHLMAANVIIPMVLGTLANALDPDDDDEIILNPIDSQFLKINIGGTSISLHPLATYVRTAMRLGTKVYLDQIENVAYNTKGRKEYQTYLGAVWDEFLNYRLNPVVSTMSLVFQRKDFMNRAVKTDDLGDWFTNIFMAGFAPISLENLSKNINEESYGKIIPEFLLDMMGYNHFHQTSTAVPQYKEYTDKVGFKFRINYPDDWKDSRKKDLFKLRVQQEFGDEVNGMINNHYEPDAEQLKDLRISIESKVQAEME